MLREQEPMTVEQTRLLSPLQMAHIGDSVWDLLIRSRLLYAGMKVQHMHREAVALVNAGAQAAALRRLEPMLTDEEKAIALRGRNAHAHHTAPKHQSQADYAASTALEALIGYLYLTGQEERLLSLFAISQQEEENHAGS